MTTEPSTDRSYCAEVCSAAGEPLAGTAIQVDVWLMLEYRRAWQAKAIDNNLLDAATQQWLHNTVSAFAANGLVARPQFIRRPERTDTIQLFVAHAADGHLGGVQVANESELQSLDLTATRLPVVDAIQYFVCINAKRDICCAKFGRPTYAALHDKVGSRAWQTTHVGGHRYAPNVLVLPQSALYGRVMTADVEDFVATIEAGELARPFLRGRTIYSKQTQAAEFALPDAGELLAEESGTVTFATADGPRAVSVQPAEHAIEVLPSCGKPPEMTTPLVVTAPTGQTQN